MIVYQNDKAGFLHDHDYQDIAELVAAAYLDKTGRYAPEAEYRAWKNSVAEMARVLRDHDIPDDSGIGIEFGIPQTSKRIDFMISGSSDSSRNLVIVELKQWSTARWSDNHGLIFANRGGHRETEGTHPCYQAWSYASLLRGFNEAIYANSIVLAPCAYLHNYPRDGVIDDDMHYGTYLSEAPLFLKGADELHKLREFIKQHVKYGDKAKLIYEIEHGRIRPSKMLIDSVVGMLQGNQEFVLVDDQKVAFENALRLAQQANNRKKRVVIVQGGPGTGKSVIAINLLARFLANKQVSAYVTRNAAPRAVLLAKLTGSLTRNEISSLFKGSGAFTETQAEAFDALIVDEAHRLNEKSGLYGNLGENQIKEVLHSSKCAIFFVDDDQIVTLSDIGHSVELERWAKSFDADVSRFELTSQFRCAGSDGYLEWLDDVLGIRSSQSGGSLDQTFDFRIIDSPTELHELIAKRNKETNKSRVVAGYCWDWVSRRDASKCDITFPEFGYAKKWNLSEDGSQWIIRPNSINEVGCIHTCQGLELDYVGVIIGPDLIVRNGTVRTDPSARSRMDRTIRGWKTLMRKNPVATERHIDRIIRNTYRTLMTRGLKGCYIYCCDGETQRYFKDRAKRGSFD